MHFSAVAVTTVLYSLARGVALQPRDFSGEATFYGGNLHGGTCSFSTYTLPSGIYGTALSDSNWDNAGNCGACITVNGPGGKSITAMIVDQCPGCGLNHLDLFPDAFDVFADPSTGVIQVTWDFIECPIITPLQLVNKQGVSAYWFSMQVVNANKAVSTLEVSTDGGSTWTITERQSYNFFQYSSGFGTTIVDVKVTSIDNDVIVVNNVYVASGASTTASGNFGSSGAAADISSGASSTQILAADVSTTSSPAATSPEASGAPPEMPTGFISLPSPSGTSPYVAPTTIATIYKPSTPSTTSLAAVSTVTVYSHEDCPA